jgi:hypothetical protein
MPAKPAVLLRELDAWEIIEPRLNDMTWYQVALMSTMIFTRLKLPRLSGNRIIVPAAEGNLKCRRAPDATDLFMCFLRKPANECLVVEVP